MKRKIIILTVLFIVLCSISLICSSFFVSRKIKSKKNVVTYSENEKNYIGSDIAIMMETGSGTGIYNRLYTSTWPESAYPLNTTLSYCEGNQGKSASAISRQNDGTIKINFYDPEYSFFQTYGPYFISSVGKCYLYFDYPNIYATLRVTQSGSNIEVPSNTWVHSTPTFTFTKTAGASLYYCTDTANTCNPSLSLGTASATTVAGGSLNTTGSKYIRYKVVNGSFTSPISSYYSKIDTSSPTVSITAQQISLGTSVSSGAAVPGPIKFKLTSSTTSSSGSTIYYCHSTSASCNPSTIVTSGTFVNLSSVSTGTYYIRYKIETGAGYNSGISTFTYTYNPNSLVTLTAKNKASTTISSGSWSTSGLNYNLVLDGSLSSYYANMKLYYNVTTSSSCPTSTSSYSNTSVVSGTNRFFIQYAASPYNNMIYNFCYYVNGNVNGTMMGGTATNAMKFTAKVDDVVPSLTAVLRNKDDSVYSGTTWAQQVKYKIDGTAGVSGINASSLRVLPVSGTGSCPTYNGNWPISGTIGVQDTFVSSYGGTRNVCYYATSIAGLSKTGNFTMKHDTEKPTLTIYDNDEAGYCPDSTTQIGWINTNKVLGVNVSDSQSGMNCSYQFQGFPKTISGCSAGSTSTYSVTQSVSTEGENSFTFRFTDISGRDVNKVCYTKIDKTGPSGGVAYVYGVLTPGPYGRVDLSDAGAGIDCNINAVSSSGWSCDSLFTIRKDGTHCYAYVPMPTGHCQAVFKDKIGNTKSFVINGSGTAGSLIQDPAI